MSDQSFKPTDLFGCDPDFVAVPSDYQLGQRDERKRSVLLIADAYGKGREDAARDVEAMRPRLYPDFTCINYDAAVAAARGKGRKSDA